VQARQFASPKALLDYAEDRRLFGRGSSSSAVLSHGSYARHHVEALPQNAPAGHRDGAVGTSFIPAAIYHRSTGNIYAGRRSTGMPPVQDTDRVQECLAAAEHCEQRAAATTDPAAKATFAEVARCWHELARCWREMPKAEKARAPLTSRHGAIAKLLR
jgi:hypothetical protein